MEREAQYESPAAWRAWVISHADYYTVIRRKNMQNERYEYPTLPQARAMAQQLVTEGPHKSILIYAVAGVHDTYLETVSMGSQNATRSNDL
jgi:hypothetical protein